METDTSLSTGGWGAETEVILGQSDVVDESLVTLLAGGTSFFGRRARSQVKGTLNIAVVS